MNRRDFQGLAERRLREARVLYDNRLYSGAYYLGGYAVECALKACICKKTRKGDFPRDRQALDNIFTHDLERLIKGAELNNPHKDKMDADQAFAVNWATVKDWSEEARYQVHTQKKARDFLQAIDDPTTGIMAWLQNSW
jgi:HEPN domain-containing protein